MKEYKKCVEIIRDSNLGYSIDRHFADYVCALHGFSNVVHTSNAVKSENDNYRNESVPLTRGYESGAPGRSDTQNLGLTNELDIPAEICDLWLLAMFVSYFSHKGDSAFSVSRLTGVNIEEIFSFYDYDENFISHRIKKEIGSFKIPELNTEKLLSYTRVIGIKDNSKPLIYDGELFYITKFFEYEYTIANFIKQRILCKDSFAYELKKEINNVFPDNYIEGRVINYQKVAAILALHFPFALISGGPGTGKTTTVGLIISLLLIRKPDMVIKMVAPTGKAADRLKESIKNFKSDSRYRKLIPERIFAEIPETAQTIHKFLGLNSRKLTYDKYHKAPVDVLIIDEASMISLPLFAKLFEALPDTCRVILLGDKDQLTAVENGNVLRDITDMDSVNKFSPSFVKLVSEITDDKLVLSEKKEPLLTTDTTVQLEYSWRFKEKSGIGILAKVINEAGTESSIDEILRVSKVYENIEITLAERLGDTSTLPSDFYNRFLKKYFAEYFHIIDSADPETALHKLHSFKILCAVNSGPFGVNAINELVEKEFISGKSSTLRFYHGQPILITKNDYRLNLMNGDVGVILRNNKGILSAYFSGISSEDPVREFNPASIEEYKTAFSISIHKSQGTEFDEVFILLPPRKNPIITKELLYTAITRAKYHCHIFASSEILYHAAVTPVKRQSGLKKKILASTDTD